MGPYKNSPLSRTVSNSVVGDEGCRVRLRRPPPLRACGPRVLRWKTLRVSSAPHPCGFESLCDGRKKKGLHHWRPNKSMVGDEGCRVRLRRPLPLRRFAPRVLRWKTLRVSSAPHPAGFESHVLGTKRKASITGGLTNQVVGDEGCRVRLRRPLPLRRFAPRVLRWKTLRVSSAPHPAGFESHVLGTKRKASITGGLTNQVVGDEGFEPPALCV